MSGKVPRCPSEDTTGAPLLLRFSPWDREGRSEIVIVIGHPSARNSLSPALRIVTRRNALSAGAPVADVPTSRPRQRARAAPEDDRRRYFAAPHCCNHALAELSRGFWRGDAASACGPKAVTTPCHAPGTRQNDGKGRPGESSPTSMSPEARLLGIPSSDRRPVCEHHVAGAASDAAVLSVL